MAASVPYPALLPPHSHQPVLIWLAPGLELSSPFHQYRLKGPSTARENGSTCPNQQCRFHHQYHLTRTRSARSWTSRATLLALVSAPPPRRSESYRPLQLRP